MTGDVPPPRPSRRKDVRRAALGCALVLSAAAGGWSASPPQPESAPGQGSALVPVDQPADGTRQWADWPPRSRPARMTSAPLRRSATPTVSTISAGPSTAAGTVDPATVSPATVDPATAGSVSALPHQVGGDPTAGWRSPIVENFDGTLLDQDRWRVYEDPTGYHPRRASNVRVGGGELQLTGVGDASGGVASRLNLWFGRWEARFRVDRGAGYSAAVLLWPEDERWPDHGEIDLIEVPHGDRVLGVSTVHHGAQNAMAAYRLSSDFTQWHTVAVDWLADRITFYLDGVATTTLRRPAAGSFDYIPRESAMHLTLQNDKGCDAFIQCPDASTPAEVTMHVDWVRIYATG